MFSGDSLDFIYLKDVTLYRMTGVNGAWDRLLSDWASCGTYREQAEFSERIETLESSLPMPPALRHQIALCKSESKKAFDTIDTAEEKESDYIQRIENGVRTGRLSLIAFGASLLQSHAKEDFAEFKRDSEDRMAKILKNLEMYDERDKLLAQVDKVSRSFEQMIQAQDALRKYQSLETQFGTIADEIPVAHLDSVGVEAGKWLEL